MPLINAALLAWQVSGQFPGAHWDLFRSSRHRVLLDLLVRTFLQPQEPRHEVGTALSDVASGRRRQAQVLFDVHSSLDTTITNVLAGHGSR